MLTKRLKQPGPPEGWGHKPEVGLCNYDDFK